MKQFTTLISSALPIRTENIDTDQIIPAVFLKTTTQEGLGRFLFHRWRFAQDGSPKTESVFHNPDYNGAKILIAGNNFGCGSSREHAVWALADYGFSAIVSSSFGDIFFSNCLKNGLLPVTVTHTQLDQLLDLVENNPSTMITIDLAKQIVTIPNVHRTIKFAIDPFRKTCLLTGVDDLGYMLAHEKQIKAYEKKHPL